MPSKRSRTTTSRRSRSNAARICSERELTAFAAEIAGELREAHARRRPVPRVLLEGPMGTGKSTFARALIEALQVDRPSEGSPTFAIAHEYRSPDGLTLTHADGYRLRSEAELEETGLVETLWDPERLVVFEWPDLFPGVFEKLGESGLPVVRVTLAFAEGSAALRSVTTART